MQLLLLVLCFMVVKMSTAHQIEIFSIKSHPVSTDGMQADVCQLDALRQFEWRLSVLSHDVEAIKTLTKENEVYLIHVMTCQYRAAAYGLEKLPAIVIDKEVVTYGLTSVARALSILKDKGDDYA